MNGTRRNPVRACVSWLWRWSLLVTVPIGSMFLLWVVRTSAKYVDLGLEFQTLNNTVNLRSVGGLEAQGIIRDTRLALLPRTSRTRPGLRIIRLYLPEASEAALLDELPHSGRSYVDASLGYPDGELRPVEVKLRGDHFWHWAGRKQSLRIKTKKSQLWERIRAINLSAPKMADQWSEHVSYWLALELGLIAPRSEMVELALNGRTRGVYLLVEQMEEMTLRTNGKMPGDLYAGDVVNRDVYRGLPTRIFENAGLWEKIAINNHFPEDENEALEQLIACIQEPSSPARSARLRDLVDMEAFGTFAAFRVLCQSQHYDETHNWRLYYDPWRNRFLPAVWDPVGWHEGWVPRPGRKARIDMVTSRLDEALFEDVAFLDARQAAFDRYFHDGVHERLLAYVDELSERTRPSIERDPGLGRMMDLLAPGDAYAAQAATRAQMVSIADAVKDAFERPPVVQYALVEPGRDALRVEVSGRRGLSGLVLNLERPPEGRVDATVSWATATGFQRVDVSGAVVVQDAQVVIDVPLFPAYAVTDRGEGSVLSRRVVSAASATYDVALSGPGMEENGIVLVAARTGDDTDVAASRQDILEVRPLAALQRVVVEAPRSDPLRWEGEVSLEGVATISKDVLIMPGTRINMSPGATVIFEGRVMALGTRAQPIRVGPASAGQEPWGVFALRGPGADGSQVAWVDMFDGSGHKEPLAEYSAMFSIHDADDVTVSNCRFRDSHVVDDMVHVVYSTVRISDCLFERSLFDAVDIDISEAVVERCRFVESGNDALDLMTSTVLVRDNSIERSADKGISVGEDTRAQVINCAIVDCEIGIQIKDRSQAVVANCELRDNRLGIDAYKKNWRYDSGGFGYIYKSIVQGSGPSLTADKHSAILVHDCSVSPAPAPSKRVRMDDLCDDRPGPAARDRVLRRFPEEEGVALDAFRPSWAEVDPARRGLRSAQ